MLNACDVIEPVHIEDKFVTDISRIENVGPCVRYTFCVESQTPSGLTEKQVVCKLVIPRRNVLIMLAQSYDFLMDVPKRLVRRMTLHH
jgi:hypothetical protein